MNLPFYLEATAKRQNVDLQDPVAVNDCSILASLVHQHVGLLLLVKVYLCMELEANTVQLGTSNTQVNYKELDRNFKKW